MPGTHPPGPGGSVVSNSWAVALPAASATIGLGVTVSTALSPQGIPAGPSGGGPQSPPQGSGIETVFMVSTSNGSRPWNVIAPTTCPVIVIWMGLGWMTTLGSPTGGSTKTHTPFWNTVSGPQATWWFRR